MDDSTFELLMKLKENIFLQAQVFLKEAGEFYPFASVINNDDSVSPVGVHLDQSHPSSQEVIDRLQRGIEYGFNTNAFKFAALCLDILITTGDQERSAMELRLLSPQGPIATFRTYYQLGKNGELSYEDLQLVKE